MSVLLTLISLVLYLFAAGFYGTRLLLPDAQEKSLSVPRWLVRVGIVVQFFAIGAYCITVKRSPFAGMFGTLSFAGWSIAIAFAVFELRLRVGVAGAIALLCASMFLFRALLFSGEVASTDTVLRNPLITIHVAAILISFGLFVVAFAASLLYLCQDRELKRKRVRPAFRRLPSLQTLDKTAWSAVAVALPLMTIGLALGMVRVFGTGLAHTPAQWFLDPHTIMSFLAWGVYIFYIGARLGAGWYGNRLQYILIIGMALVLSLTFAPSLPHKFV